MAQPRKPSNPGNLDPEKYARLVAEAKAPYRGLRQFVYIAFALSGFIGAFIFFTQALAGRDVGHALPNLALQLGITALMIVLFRWEQKTADRDKSS